MCYSGKCPHEDAMGDCTHHTLPYPCPEGMDGPPEEKKEMSQLQFVIPVMLKSIEDAMREAREINFEVTDGFHHIRLLGRPEVLDKNGTKTITIKINGGAKDTGL